MMEKDEYITIDYPCDMNVEKYQLFVDKSVANNFRYAGNDHYVCTIQSRWQDLADFKARAKELEPILCNPKKIIGIGNLCRIMWPTAFTEYVFDFISATYPGRRVHIYGLAYSMIKRYVPRLERRDMVVSVDSTKWTKISKGHKGIDRGTRFANYIKKIQKLGIEVIC
jgi:hypothetical protein